MNHVRYAGFVLAAAFVALMLGTLDRVDAASAVLATQTYALDAGKVASRDPANELAALAALDASSIDANTVLATKEYVAQFGGGSSSGGGGGPDAGLFLVGNVPPAASWTIFNSIDNVAVADDPQGGVLFTRDGNVSTDYLTGGYLAITNPTYFTCGIGISQGIALAAGSQINGGGLFLGDGTQLLEVSSVTASTVRYFTVARWNSPTSLNSLRTLTDQPSTARVEEIQRGAPWYVFFVADGSNITVKVGYTGRVADAYPIYSEATGAFLGTITRCGVFMRGSTLTTAVPTRHWIPYTRNTSP